MSVIVVRRGDEGVSIMRLQGVALDALSPEQFDKTVAAEIAKWPLPDQAAVVSWREMPDEAVPADRYFRAAWTDATSELVVGIDMRKAREAHREHLRLLRAPKLAALDIDYQREDEVGDTRLKKAVAKRKQALRDVTDDPAIDAAQTPEELKAVVPAALTT
jgi:hypothetical protein